MHVSISSAQTMSTTKPVALEEHSQPRIVSVLLSIAKSTRQLMGLKLAEIGVVPGQDQLLDVLTETDGMSVSRIADALSVRPSTVSKMLDHFVEKDWAVREGDQKDMRKTVVRLTETGMKMQEQVRDVWATLEGDLLISFNRVGIDGSGLSGLTEIDGVLTKKIMRLR